MNLIANGDFESNLDGWTAAAGGGASAIERSTEQAKSGSYSCKLTTGAQLGHAEYVEVDALTPLVTHTVSVWFYRTETDADLQLEARYDDNTGDWASAVLPQVAGWSRVEIVGIVQAGDTNLRLRVAIPYSVSDVTVYIDSVLVEELPNPARSLLR